MAEGSPGVGESLAFSADASDVDPQVNSNGAITYISPWASRKLDPCRAGARPGACTQATRGSVEDAFHSLSRIECVTESRHAPCVNT